MHITEQRQSEKNPAWPTQKGLMLVCIVAAALVVFGGGFIAGMLYRTHENMPSGAAIRPVANENTTQDQAGTQKEDALTFYDTLTASQMTYAPLTPEAEGPDNGSLVILAAPAPSPPAASVPPLPGYDTPPSQREEHDEAAPVETARRRAKDTGTSRETSGASSRGPLALRRSKTPAPSPSVASEAAPRSAPAARRREVKKSQEVQARNKPNPVVPASQSQDGLSVQVGSFSTPERAEQLRQRLVQKGYPARVQPSVVSGQAVRYRVRVGNYSTPERASQAAGYLRVQEQVPAVIAR